MPYSKFASSLKVSFLVVLWMCSMVLIAQRVKIYGKVTDNQGEGIALAHVRVVGHPWLTTTNLKGEYQLYCQTTDTLTVVFSQIGYASRRKQLLSPQDSIRMDALLYPLSQSISGAVVSGRKRDTNTQQTIKKEALQHLPSTTGNAVEELIQSQAGVSTHNELSSQYNVRGGSFDENVVYINGIEIFRPMLVRSGRQEGLSVIHPDMVEKISFSSGGFAAHYGDKMSSVLDITYKMPERLEAKVSGSLLGGNTFVGWGNKHMGAMASLRYKTTKYLLGSLDTNGEYKPRFLDYQAYGFWRPSAAWNLELLGNISDNHFNFYPKDRETAFGTIDQQKTFKVYFDGKEKDFFRTYFGAASLKRLFSPHMSLQLRTSTYATQEQENYDISGEYWLQDATEQEMMGIGTYLEHARNRLTAHVYNVGLHFEAQTPQRGNQTNFHTLLCGVNFRGEKVIDHTREWEMRDSMGHSLPTLPDELPLYYSLKGNNKLTTHRWEVYAEDTWRRRISAGLLHLNVGLRYTYTACNQESLISPRLNIGFLPSANDHWSFRLATGVYYQPPFFKELSKNHREQGMDIVELNKAVKAQRSIHVVAGADYTFRMFDRPFKFTTEAYYKNLSRLNPYTVDNLRIVYAGQNKATGYVVGTDLKLYGEFVPGTDSWVTLSIMKAQQKIEGISMPQPTDQRYNFSLFLTDYFPGSTRWRASLKMAFADGLPFNTPHQKYTEVFRAPAYKRVDLGIDYRLPLRHQRMKEAGLPLQRQPWMKNVWLGIDVFNLMGIENVNSYYWVTDITNTSYAVPNYLTGRLINFHFSIDF